MLRSFLQPRVTGLVVSSMPYLSEQLFSLLLVQDSLPEKLAVHEKNVREFDAFVETLQ